MKNRQQNGKMKKEGFESKTSTNCWTEPYQLLSLTIVSEDLVAPIRWSNYTYISQSIG